MNSDDAGLGRHLGDADGAVPAHGAHALVVEKEYADVPVLTFRGREYGSEHVFVSARFFGEKRAQVVKIFSEKLFFLKNGFAFYLLNARGDYTYRLSCCMSIDDVNDSFKLKHYMYPP